MKAEYEKNIRKKIKNNIKKKIKYFNSWRITAANFGMSFWLIIAFEVALVLGQDNFELLGDDQVLLYT